MITHHKPGLALIFTSLCLAWAAPVRADTLIISGIINQSTQDGTGPAENNPDLNNILDGDVYTFDLSFTGSITAPGTYDLTGSQLLFNVGASGAAEKNFDSISLTVAQSGGFDSLSILACLTTGSGCNQGNEIDLNFSILAVDLNSQNVTANAIPGLLPLDLLEDDGVTDIHGSATSYSYTPGGTSSVPEPSSVILIGSGLLALVVSLKQARQRFNNRLF